MTPKTTITFIKKSIKIFLSLIIFACLSCSSNPENVRNNFSNKVFSFNNGEIIFNAGFEGAYLSHITQVEENTFEIISIGEDYPIDKSPTYAFKILSKNDQKIILNIHFKGSKAPATPKISSDGIHWETIACDIFQSDLLMNIHLKANDTIWVARHPLYTSKHLNNWVNEISIDKRVHVETCGKTVENKDLKVLDIYSGKAEDKNIIVFLARQHPTEVPGQFVFNTYIETILENFKDESSFFKSNRIIAFPLVNLDAVDHGRWRHNMNGVDLNRHWNDTTTQQEIRHIIDFLSQEPINNKMKFAIDFHSRDGENIYIVRNDDLIPTVKKWNALINKQNPPETYKIVTKYNNFVVGNNRDYSSTWFTKRGIPVLTHETTHDVDYNKAIATAKIAAKAFVELMEESK